MLRTKLRGMAAFDASDDDLTNRILVLSNPRVTQDGTFLCCPPQWSQLYIVGRLIAAYLFPSPSAYSPSRFILKVIKSRLTISSHFASPSHFAK